MTDEAAQRVRQLRYALYSRAMDALHAGDAAGVLASLIAETRGCRRAVEAIELAEFHVAFRFPKRGVEHFVRQLERCSECRRERCVAEEDACGASPEGGSASSKGAGSGRAPGVETTPVTRA